tara:strand:- start:801 stop:1034 length:234 start_codon:yes stop_codon:yes gene_type:complete
MLNENPFANEDPMWRIRMQTLMKRKKNMEIKQIIDEVLQKFYSEKGLPVPQWRQNTNPDWWLDYLTSLGYTHNNEKL